MMSRKQRLISTLCLIGASIALAPMIDARADVITDWNAKAEAISIEKRLPPPPNARGMAILHVAIFEAVNAIEKRYSPYRLKLTAEKSLPKEAAAAAAGHAVLIALHPDKRAELDAMLVASVAKIPDDASKTKAMELGRQSAAEILALRAKDGADRPESYRPLTVAGAYVPTVIPISSTVGAMTPWAMTSGSQFRPAPPPALTSMTWTNDVNEIREYGGRVSQKRTAEQTDIGRFWFMTGPQAWNPVVRQLAEHKKLDITDNARLFALVAMATSDAFIAVFDGKYHFNFWRPLTAIRNADLSENNATPRDASWVPLGDTPMHPEYPCAHCITSGAAATVLQGFFGNEIPEVAMTSATAPGVTRRWNRLSDYSDEVAMARIYAGFHYRFSTKVGQDMGRKIAELVVATQLRSTSVAAAPTR
jgi:hypothetical protein